MNFETITQHTIADIKAKHGGKLCECTTCRGRMITACAFDMALAYGDESPVQSLQALCAATMNTFLANGLTAEDAIRQIAVLSRPEDEYLGVNISITSLDKAEYDLMRQKTDGSA